MDKEKSTLYHKNQALYEFLEYCNTGLLIPEKKTYNLIMECNSAIRLEQIALDIFKERKELEKTLKEKEKNVDKKKSFISSLFRK